MSTAAGIVTDLQHHLKLCQNILAVVERENQSLRDETKGPDYESYQAKKNLLPQLDASLNQIRQHRAVWQKLDRDGRAQYPEVPGLLRQNQDLIMKIIVLTRENEQVLLRKGLVPPRHLPSPNQQKPHFVADLYRRTGR